VPARDLVGAIAVESCKAALHAHQKVTEIQSAMAAQQAAAVAQLRKDQRLVDAVLRAAERVQREREKLFDELDAAASVFIAPANAARFRELLDPERLCDTPLAETWQGVRAMLVTDPRGAELLKKGSFLMIGNQFAGAKGLGLEVGYGLAVLLPDTGGAGSSDRTGSGPRYWVYVFVGGLGTPGAAGSGVAQVGLFRGTPAPGSRVALGWSRPFGEERSKRTGVDTRFLPVMDIFFDFPVQDGKWVAETADWLAAHVQGAVLSVGFAASPKSYTRAGDILGAWALQGGYAWSFPLNR
jgi:hypothetical protein